VPNVAVRERRTKLEPREINKMAAAVAVDPTVCSGDEKCKCRLTQQTLLADKDKRVAAMKAADPISKVTADADRFPRDVDNGWLVHKDMDEWVCSSKLCGHSIVLHPAAATVAATDSPPAVPPPAHVDTVNRVRLEAVSAMYATASSESASPNVIAMLTGRRCVICDAPPDKVRNAHILRSREQAERAGPGVPTPKDVGNYLSLCGTKLSNVTDEQARAKTENLCHHYFDSFTLSFVPLPNDDDASSAADAPGSAPERDLRAEETRLWLVVSKDDERNGKVVALPRCVSRRAMQVHSQQCLLASERQFGAWLDAAIEKALKCRAGLTREDYINSWRNNLTPPDSNDPSPDTSRGGADGTPICCNFRDGRKCKGKCRYRHETGAGACQHGNACTRVKR
jgi:hypothetical protein